MTDKAKTSEVPTLPTSSHHTPAELAEFIGCDAKSLRRHMRKLTTERAGRGGSWDIAHDDALRIIASFKSCGGRMTPFVFADDVVTDDVSA